MDTLVQSDPHLDLEFRIDAFEEARRVNRRVDLARFLPPREHPSYLKALAELIRVELDHGWAEHNPKPLREYCRQFPEIGERSELLRDLAYEEYRLRRQAGEPVEPADYQSAYGVEV